MRVKKFKVLKRERKKRKKEKLPFLICPYSPPDKIEPVNQNGKEHEGPEQCAQKLIEVGCDPVCGPVGSYE